MNQAAIHLALNNFPPIINFAALIVLAIAIFWRSAAVVRTALVLLVISALFALPVYLTGEPAEEIVEEMEGVNRRAIHTHEDAGEYAIWLLEAQGLAALAALVFYRSRDLTKWALVVIVLLAIMSTLAVFRTAYLGGKVRHPESEMGRRTSYSLPIFASSGFPIHFPHEKHRMHVNV